MSNISWDCLFIYSYSRGVLEGTDRRGCGGILTVPTFLVFKEKMSSGNWRGGSEIKNK